MVPFLLNRLFNYVCVCVARQSICSSHGKRLCNSTSGINLHLQQEILLLHIQVHNIYIYIVRIHLKADYFDSALVTHTTYPMAIFIIMSSYLLGAKAKG